MNNQKIRTIRLQLRVQFGAFLEYPSGSAINPSSVKRQLLMRTANPLDERDLVAISMLSRRSPLNREAVSSFIVGTLNPNDLALILDWNGLFCVRQSFQIHSEPHSCANGRTNRRKHKGALLTNVADAALALLGLPIFIPPREEHFRLQVEPNAFSARLPKLHLVPRIRSTNRKLRSRAGVRKIRNVVFDMTYINVSHA